MVECEKVAGGRWLCWSVRGWKVGVAVVEGGRCEVAVVECERVAGGRWPWWSVRGWQVGVAVVECERVGGGCGGV